MVVGAFPAAKLGLLIFKQISKPIAASIREQAKTSPFFRKYICMPPAQFYNWCEVKSKMWVLNLGKPVNIPVLNETMAIELGANLLGEAIIFLFAAVALVSEYQRSARKEAAKEENKRKEMSEIQNAITELYIQSEEQAAHIRELTRKLGYIDTSLQHMIKNYKPPPEPEPEPEPKEIPKKDPCKEFSCNPNSVDPPRPTNIIFGALDELREQFWSKR